MALLMDHFELDGVEYSVEISPDFDYNLYRNDPEVRILLHSSQADRKRDIVKECQRWIKERKGLTIKRTDSDGNKYEVKI